MIASSGMSTTATVVSVNRKETPGVGKIPREQITLVANYGVEGDYHAGTLIRHRSRVAQNPDQPNLRQVHIIHSELFDELAPLGIAVTPGAMGENITTRGLAILDLAPGARLRIGESVLVQITGLRNPCNQLDGVDERLLQQVALKAEDGSIVRKAGIMGIVLEGGIVSPGDAITVEVPDGVSGRLQPV